jgi:hypothetical protein
MDRLRIDELDSAGRDVLQAPFDLVGPGVVPFGVAFLTKLAPGRHGPSIARGGVSRRDVLVALKERCRIADERQIGSTPPGALLALTARVAQGDQFGGGRSAIKIAIETSTVMPGGGVAPEGLRSQPVISAE